MSVDEQAVIEAMTALQDAHVIVSLPALSTFMAISTIQLAVRHPDFPPNMLPRPEGPRVEVARLLSNAVAPDPDSELHTVLLMGWDPTYDHVEPRR